MQSRSDPKDPSATIELDYSSDRQWHKTGSDKWYFSGPYYCQNAKFRYKTSGLPANARIKFEIHRGATKFFNVTLAPSSVWKDVNFKGHLGKTPPAKNYLNPDGAYYTAKLFVVGAVKPTPVEKKFKVKSRTLWWLDTQIDSNPATPDEVGLTGRALVHKLKPAGSKVSNDVNSSAEILAMEHNETEWKTIYGYLTVAATFYSVGHGSVTGTGTNAKYGGVFLPVDTVFKGFKPGTNYTSGGAYDVPALGLWDLKVWLKHCWTANKSPATSGSTVPGPSVAKTLDMILEQPPGSSRTMGYKGLYQNRVQPGPKYSNVRFRPASAQIDHTQIIAKLKSLIPDGNAFVKLPYKGDPTNVDIASIKTQIERWTKAKFNLTFCEFVGLEFDSGAEEIANNIVIY